MSWRYRVLVLLLAGGLLEWAVQAAAGLFGAQVDEAAMLFAALGFLLAGLWPSSGRSLLYLVVVTAPTGLIFGQVWAHHAPIALQNGLVLNGTMRGAADPWVVGSAAAEAFLLGAFYAWLAVQRGEAWSAVALAGATFLLRADVDPAYADRFLLFVGAALVLVVLISARGSGRVPSSLTAMALGLAIVIVAWQAPVPNPIWAHPFDDPVTGLVSQEVPPATTTELDLNGAFHPSNRLVMSIKVPGRAASPYWQTAVFDRYDGKSWRISVGPTRRAAPGVGLDGGRTQTGPLVLTAQVKVLQATQVIVSPGTVLQVSEPATALFVPHTPDPVMVRSQRLLGVGAEYQVEGALPIAGPAVVPPLAPAALNAYLQLPREPARLHLLALQVVQGRYGSLDELTAILAYLRDNSTFHYDVNAGSPPGSDAVDDFLFRSHRGYCSQFASAMVVLAREVGIPARLVAGYATGSLMHGRYIVRQRDAHSWVEGYIPGSGWIAFDPTPGFFLDPGITRQEPRPAVAAALRGRIPATARALAPAVAPRAASSGAVDTVPAARLLIDHIGRPTPLLGGLAALCALVIWWLYRNRPRSLEEMYAGVARGHTSRHLKIGAAETPGEFVERWQVHPHDYPSVQLIAQLYTRQRYGGTPTAPSDLREARRAWRRLRCRVFSR